MVRAKPQAPAVDMLFHENEACCRGFRAIAGIDEVGRGPLAGPVVAAAVIVPPGVDLCNVRDSKELSAAQREACYADILSLAADIGVGFVDSVTIDRINILQATFKAMVLAVTDLRNRPDYLLIDGPYKLPLPVDQLGVTGGDALCRCVAAASIVAKVHRDRMMLEWHKVFPAYGFDRHKGYATRDHIEALRIHGPCPIHRRTFRSVAECLGQDCTDSQDK